MITLSCQKDNELSTLSSDNQSQIDLKKGYAEEHNFMLDPITNYPDPCYGSTTISYHLKINSKVMLVAAKNNSTYLVVLVDEIQTAGLHQITFLCPLSPAGEYTAHLKIGKYDYYEKITKKDPWEESKFLSAENN